MTVPEAQDRDEYGLTFAGRQNIYEITPATYADYPVLVPQVDADGNEIAGIRLPDITVPLGTRTGWNIRTAGFAPGALMVVGSFIPFATTVEERRAAGDCRPSLKERYPSRAHYIEAVRRAATKLQKERLLLIEDVKRYVTAAETVPLNARPMSG